MAVGKKEILAAQDWDFEEFDVPTWGRVRIRSLSARERLELVKQFGSDRLGNDQACEFFFRLIVLSLVYDQGAQVFDLNGDVEQLATRNWNRLSQVAERIMTFNGMNKASAGAIEKN